MVNGQGVVDTRRRRSEAVTIWKCVGRVWKEELACGRKITRGGFRSKTEWNGFIVKSPNFKGICVPIISFLVAGCPTWTE
jgi:hypothetical protein